MFGLLDNDSIEAKIIITYLLDVISVHVINLDVCLMMFVICTYMYVGG